MSELTQDYAALADRMSVVHAAAVDIDPVKKLVTLGNDRTLGYDRLIVAPGIDFRWNAIQGYSAAVAEKFPHAWKAGAQTLLLRRQIEAMPDGGVFILAAPANPFRCPSAPYERAALIAHYFKQTKPRCKILILDAKDRFSQQALFQDAWKARYGDMIEWVPLSKDGRVTRLIAEEMTVVTEFGQRHRAAAINIIPPQFAGKIARDTELANQSGWCPVDPATFESTLHKGIQVIGDACIAGAMPKSGFAANSQGKVAAMAAVNAINGRPTVTPVLADAAYSLLAPDYGISLVNTFRVGERGIVATPNAGGASPRNANAVFRRQEAHYAEGWYAAMTQEIWRS